MIGFQVESLQEAVALMASGKRVLIGCHTHKELEFQKSCVEQITRPTLGEGRRFSSSRSHHRIADTETNGFIRFFVADEHAAEPLRGLEWDAANGVALSLDMVRPYVGRQKQ